MKHLVESGEAPAKGLTISREKTFLYDKAWQLSVPQTVRGMAALALLSCLQVYM
jgi:hypothetical protein